jgi:pimeloyl-ACP methyl ester carboxylesterase
MEKLFVPTKNGAIFCRKIGTGPLLFLLHPSPRSGALLESLAQMLALEFTVIIPDMPGYGKSDVLPFEILSMSDYIPTYQELFGYFSNDAISLYGTATGAQLAIAYGLQNPQQIRQLYLDNCAHFTETECDAILSQYFIEMSPTEDGSHLTKLWQHIKDSCLYFPWYEQNEAHRINDALPPVSVLQSMFNDYMAAGSQYSAAYKAAFKHERAAHIQKLMPPTVIFKWKGSPILQYIEQLCNFELPPNIKIVTTEKEMAQRYSTMVNTMIHHK